MSQSPDVPSRPGAGGSPPISFVFPGISSPTATTQLFEGAPFTVQGRADSEPGGVTGLTGTFDGAAVTATDDSTARNWSDWHAVIAPASTGPHVLVATASGSGKTNAQTVRLQAYPVLSCVSPRPAQELSPRAPHQ
jgi:hypothetical protein